MVGRVIRINPAPARDAQKSGKEAALRFLAPGRVSLPVVPPLSLYIHFPWCVRKCPYCDFNSHEVGAAGFPEAQYLASIRSDIEQSLPLVWGRRVQSVFIGGGTPSLLSAAGLDRLLGDARALLPLEPDAEITLEANPGTFEARKFREFRGLGINRLSVGVQSFDDAHLHALGRIHSGDDALRALEIAANYFDNFNIDLMYALPGQSIESVRSDLARARFFAPTHLSIYHLTLEPNTVFAKYPPALPDQDAAAQMQDAIEADTAGAGYDRYEVSAYARKGYVSRHNLNYWTFGDYLGVGPGAHGKLSFPDRIVRQARYRNPDSYLKAVAHGTAVAEENEIAVKDLGFEFMLNALRLRDGVSMPLFAERTGLPLLVIQRALDESLRRGMLDPDPAVLRASSLGWRFLNDLQQLFLPD